MPPRNHFLFSIYSVFTARSIRHGSTISRYIVVPRYLANRKHQAQRELSTARHNSVARACLRWYCHSIFPNVTKTVNTRIKIYYSPNSLKKPANCSSKAAASSLCSFSLACTAAISTGSSSSKVSTYLGILRLKSFSSISA